jgi:8-oxo-dGTP pyrophosphatase MutT (NUDIX family)
MRPTHAGGVVYKAGQNGVEYLLVGPKKKRPGQTEWLLPKGHIEKSDKTFEETAMRELEEETGVKAIVIAPLEVVSFRLQEKPIDVMFYLMEKTHGNAGPGDGRLHEWFPFEEALRKATHSTTKTLLRSAELKRLARESEIASR